LTVLGLDVGEKRIGVAISDPTELLARPLQVLNRKSTVVDCSEIVRIAATNDARTIVVGMPLSSDDRVSDQGRRVLAFVRSLRRFTKVPIVSWDERYSTLDANRRMLALRMGRRRRRATIDSAAAAGILDEWLDDQRAQAVRQQREGSTEGDAEGLC